MGAWIEILERGDMLGIIGTSHPSWVRGLKSDFWLDNVTVHAESHPSWVRGLKSLADNLTKSTKASHPSWVRGLKCNGIAILGNSELVAPFMGAWIEIYNGEADVTMDRVSHPSWVRGLK